MNRQNTYQVSRRAEPDNAERPKGMIRCHVKLLDNTEFTCDVDVSVVLVTVLFQRSGLISCVYRNK